MVLLEHLLASLIGANTASGYVLSWPQSDPHQVFLGTEDVNQGAIWSEGKSPVPKNDNLDGWISKERVVAWEYLLDNIAPGGINAEGAAPGTVIASPSKTYPNYFYQWVRDSAITMKGIVNEYGKTTNAGLREVLEQYLKIQATIQGTVNPSGDYSTGGLGEPKFMVNGDPFTL